MGQIFADLISDKFCVDLFFNRNENKAIFIEKKIVTDLLKIARNKSPRTFISLSIRVVGGNFRDI